MSTAASLFPAQLHVLALLGAGLTQDQVARRLGVSQRTVRRLITHACDALGAGSTIEAVAVAARGGLI